MKMTKVTFWRRTIITPTKSGVMLRTKIGTCSEYGQAYTHGQGEAEIKENYLEGYYSLYLRKEGKETIINCLGQGV